MFQTFAGLFPHLLESRLGIRHFQLSKTCAKTSSPPYLKDACTLLITDAALHDPLLLRRVCSSCTLVR